MKNLICHQRSIHQNSDTFSRTECGHTTARKHDFHRHMKRHAKTPLAPNLLPKVACCEPHIINPLPNDHLFEITQCWIKILNVVLDCPQQMYPTKFINFFKRNNHGVQTKIFDKFTSKIFVSFATQKTSTDNKESTFDNSTTAIDSIAHAIENIFHCQTNAFKINLSFSFILQHRETGKVRYHYASNNNQ